MDTCCSGAAARQSTDFRAIHAICGAIPFFTSLKLVKEFKFFSKAVHSGYFICTGNLDETGTFLPAGCKRNLLLQECQTTLR